MSSREKIGGDRVLLADVMSDMSILTTIQAATAHEDEFTRGFSEVYGTGEIPFWLVFAGQVFLDMNYVLRDKVDRGWTQMNVCALSTKLTIQNSSITSRTSCKNHLLQRRPQV